GQFPSKMLKGTIERKGLESLTAKIPLGRLTNEADMAGAALYLASKAGAYLTAIEIPVDGGYGMFK
uniref:SDR family oxidoreductase n=1 Tax=Ramlibacter sp. TaxID=1917967 RepID=UPI0026238BDE